MSVPLNKDVTTKYKLGNVKKHVEQALNYVGNLFGVKTVYGYRATGSVPGSLHPLGRAGDLMITSKAQGQKIADYAVANAAGLGVTEVIWNHQIATKARGWKWRPYSGPSSHTDHVHLSFSEGPGTGAVDGPGVATSGTAESTQPGNDPKCAWKIDTPSIAGVGGGATCIATKVQVRAFLGVGAASTGAIVFIVGLVFLVAYGIGSNVAKKLPIPGLGALIPSSGPSLADKTQAVANSAKAANANAEVPKG